jgi:hypothetical protein
MLDKFLTGENVKVNGEIVCCRHILRTLYVSKSSVKYGCMKQLKSVSDN